IKQSMVLEEDQSVIQIDPHTGHRIWVLSTPIKSGKKVLGAIYIVAKIESVFAQMQTINSIFATGTAIALSITAVLGILLAQTITKPIADMKKQALAMAKGNFSRKVKVYRNDEIG
ncbi:HAMP domain-containing protein, partial [Alkalihalophilus lindianensis]